MKKIVITGLFLLFVISSFAQSEEASPTFDVTIERKVAFAFIEDETYYNVTVELKSFDNYFLSGVKITVKDITGKKIYKKRWHSSYLYGFSDGTIQIGKGNVLTQVILAKFETTNDWGIEIREKGIY